MELTPEQAGIIAHSLGVNLFHAKQSSKKRDKVLPADFHRNYFCASDGHNDWPTLESLERIGFVYRFVPTDSGFLTYWHVSAEGIKWFRQHFDSIVNPEPRVTIPRVGDVWDFYPTLGKKHTTRKRIDRIYWKFSVFAGKAVPYIQWSHTPKARYIDDIRVKSFLKFKAIRLISRK